MRDSLLKQSVLECYLLSLMHSLGCAAYAAHKFLSGRIYSSEGAQPMLCYSLGYYAYSLVALRSAVFTDPMFALNQVSWLVTLNSYLRSQGVADRAPLVLSTEIPTAWLNVLRMMAELGVSHSSFAWRFVLGAYTSSVVGIKVVALPAFAWYNIVRHPKPELHQPNFLPAKITMLLRFVLNYAWLGLITWRQRKASGAIATQQGPQLPALRDITSSIGPSWRALLGSLNPVALGYFAFFQSMYFIVPSIFPMLVYALLRKKDIVSRMTASSGLAMIAALTFWPIRTDKPFSASGLVDELVAVMGRAIRAYFPFKAIIEEPLSKDRRYLAAIVPHGIMPLGMSCLCFEFRDRGFRPSLLGASVLFKIPLVRQVFRVLDTFPADKKNIAQVLQRPYPRNVTFIMPGGIGEMFMIREDLEQVLIKSRKGFITAALQAGADIVPVYALGHTELYSVPDKDSRIGKFFMDLSRRWRVSIIPFWGRWGLPLLPHARPLATIVGRPIRVEEAIASPSPELVNSVHQQFLAELTRIFEKHKHVVPGYGHKQLYFEDEDVPAASVQTDAMTAEPLLPTMSLKSKM